MTISNTSRTAGPFIGNGITKDFPFSYKVFARSDVLVAQTVTATGVETIKSLEADYTITLNANQDTNPGGVISMFVAPPVGTMLAATSNIALVQSLDLTNQGGFYPKVINDALDRLVINVQQLAGRIGQGLGIGMAAITDQALAALALVQQIGGGTGSSLIGFTQAGVGAVVRSVLEKLRERVTVTDYLPKGYVIDATQDYTVYVQKAVDSLKPNYQLIFPAGVNVGVTRLVFDGKTDFSVLVEGKITNLGAKAGAAAVDTNTAARGVMATFYITNCSRFTVSGPGSINPGYREAFCIGEYLPANQAAPCSDFDISVDIIGGSLNDNMHANRIRYSTRFAFRDMTIDSLTKKPAYVNNATAYYYNWVESLLLWDCTDFEIRGLRVRNNGMNGLYIGSNCERFTITENDLQHNAGSGLQLAWSSFGNFPRNFSIRGNRAAFNRADGWDLNNTGPLIDVFGIVSGNISYYNGWGTEDMALTSPTNDGSGIGTYRFLKKMTITGNTDTECARTGCYMELVWDTVVRDNIIKKEAATSQGNGIHVLRCTNVIVESNNVNVLPSMRAFWYYGDNVDQGGVYVSSNYFFGKVINEGGQYSGSFNRNRVIANETVNMPFNCAGNKIDVTGAGQNGLYVLSDNTITEGNTVNAPNFAIVSYGHYGSILLGNFATGGNGGIRVDSCANSKVSGNVGIGTNAPGIHLLNCNNVELSTNQGKSVTGNSIRVEADCLLTHKWGNRNISGPDAYAGTFGINF